MNRSRRATRLCVLATLLLSNVTLASESLQIGSHKQLFIGPFDEHGRDTHLVESMTGVEIEADSAMVATVLNAGSKIRHASFEEFCIERMGLPPAFDAVVTNAPFCTRTGNVSKLHKPHLSSADQYFIDTGLDQVRDGGVVAADGQRAGEHVDQRGDLVAR